MLAGVVGMGLGLTSFCPGLIGLKDLVGVGSD